MPINIVKINKEDIDLYSPYSGECIYGETAGDDLGAYENDPTCLFSCFESEGWGYVSERARKHLAKKGITDIDNLEPKTVAELLDFNGVIVFEYNGGFNGTSWFAFAPAL